MRFKLLRILRRILRRTEGCASLFGNYLVFVEEGGAARHEQPYRLRACVKESVPVTARDVDGVARADFARLVAHAHQPRAREYVIDLFELIMMMRRYRMSGREQLFCEAALSYL